MTAGLSAPQKLGATRQANACQEGGEKRSSFWGAVLLPLTREDSQAAFWPKALLSALPGRHGFLVSKQSLHSLLLHGLQMNGTRPATGSTRLSPWDKSSHSGHRVDLSAV